MGNPPGPQAQRRSLRDRPHLPWSHQSPAEQSPELDESSHDAVVDCALYVDGARVRGRIPYSGADEAARESGGFVWIGLHQPTAQALSGVAAEFGLHPLAVEDAVNAHQRPKIERYGDTLFVVLKTARYCEHDALTWKSEVIETGEIMLFVGEHFIVSVRHGSGVGLEDVRKGLEAEPDLLRLGPGAVLWHVADRVVDAYIQVADEVEDDIDEVEAQVFSPSRGDDSARIYQLKRELLEFKRAVVPLSRPLDGLLGVEQLKPVHDYLRDVVDHLHRVTEQVESQDELLNAILDVNLTRVSVQQNDDMRRISAWVAIAAVPTMLAGIYGMNFQHMPELGLYYGYPLVLALMASVCLGLYRGFKRNGWL